MLHEGGFLHFREGAANHQCPSVLLVFLGGIDIIAAFLPPCPTP